MNSLYIDEEMCNLSIQDRCFLIENRKYAKLLGRFRPREIPFDATRLEEGEYPVDENGNHSARQ